MAELTSIKRLPLNDQVAAAIRDEILSGQLRAGQRLVQTEWATRFGVSRMPVRDAFLRLQSEGVLTASGGGSAIVVAITEEDIRDAYEVASVASAVAARRACRDMSPAKRDALAAAHRSYVDAVQHEDTDTAYGSSNEFHRLLNIESHSPRLIALLRTLSSGMPQLGVREIPEWRERSIEAHAEILQAVLDALPEQAGRLMAQHVVDAADVVIGYLRGQGFWQDG